MKLRKRILTGTPSSDVTIRELENRAVARRAASEGFVLLKNEDNVLPIKKGSKIGLYGAGAQFTVKGGTGSGDVNERDNINIYQGLMNAGYNITSKAWLKAFEEDYAKAREAWRDELLDKINKAGGMVKIFHLYSTTKLIVPDGSSLDPETAKNDGADTALYVVRRIAGEGKDRTQDEGDYLLSQGEKRLLGEVCAYYKNVVLIINAGSVIDLNFVEEFPNIKSIIYFSQGGQEGGNALADVISGDVTPSGKLTDTWANHYSDYPCSDIFSYLSGNTFREDYNEGIYVGYRYFDTFGVPVRYTFGYGMSYTNFDIKGGEVSVSGMGTKEPRVTVSVSVKNIGDTYSGKETVQIYASCPQGMLKKEFRRLCAFGKTESLKPGQEQTMEISFPLYGLASYCDKHHAWVMEAGKYGIWVGNSLGTAGLIGSLELDEKAVMVKCGEICLIKEELSPIEPDAESVAERSAQWLKASESLPVVAIHGSDILTEEIHYSQIPESFSGAAGDIVNAMSSDELVLLATGDPAGGQGSALGNAAQTVPGAAAETTHAAEDKYGVASIVLTDGPAGLRVKREYNIDDGKVVKSDFLEAFEGGFLVKNQKEKPGVTMHQYCTAIPVGTLLAQTWNTQLIEEVGEMIGGEMNIFETTLWLAPGMNIHRNPLCGRNFEYYSEDPVVSGVIAAAMTRGVQRVPGCGTTIKHFACNSVEDNRMGSDSVIGERALREIYLKGFEIAVKTSQPMSIMTSYNLINGVHAANSYDLCTKAARDEWGFAGTIMTDWTTTVRPVNGVCTAAGCVKAGNDLVMPGVPADQENIREALKSGELTVNELKRCVVNTINIIHSSNQYEDAVSYLTKFPELCEYIKVK